MKEIKTGFQQSILLELKNRKQYILMEKMNGSNKIVRTIFKREIAGNGKMVKTVILYRKKVMLIFNVLQKKMIFLRKKSSNNLERINSCYTFAPAFENDTAARLLEEARSDL